MPVTSVMMTRQFCRAVFIWTFLSMAKVEAPSLNLLENTNIYTTIYKLDITKKNLLYSARELYSIFCDNLYGK